MSLQAPLVEKRSGLRLEIFEVVERWSHVTWCKKSRGRLVVSDCGLRGAAQEYILGI